MVCLLIRLLPKIRCLEGFGLHFRAPPNKEGICRTYSGKRYLLEDAIRHCDRLGLSPEEIGTWLKVPSSGVQSVLKRSINAPRSSVLSRLGGLLSENVELAPSSGSMIKPLLGALAILLVVSIAWRLIASEPRSHAISGTVTFQGHPLEVGMIRFIPVETTESPRPILSGEVRNGRFGLKSGHGSDGGSYKVVISGFTGVPKQLGPVTDPLGEQLFPDVIRSATLPCSDFTFNANCD